MDDITFCYGKGYNKNNKCCSCDYNCYCKESIAIDKPVGDYTMKDQLDLDIEPIVSYEKAHNISGQVISELLLLADFNPLKFFVIICRLGNLTYEEIGGLMGVSNVCIFKYCNDMPEVLKEFLRMKKLTFLELEVVLKKFKTKSDKTSNHLQKTLQTIANKEFSSKVTLKDKCKSKYTTKKLDSTEKFFLVTGDPHE